MNTTELLEEFRAELKRRTSDGVCTVYDLHLSLSRAMLRQLLPRWKEGALVRRQQRRAYYLSAEYLVGRAVHNNMLNTGVLEEVRREFESHGHRLEEMEELPDPALGNGGLGRLAACFLDSAATGAIPLDGYGLRYRLGLFRQTVTEGGQREEPDVWQTGGDPWSVRREGEAVQVSFGDKGVLAVPYDTPVVGYGEHSIGTMRLWQSESLTGGMHPGAPEEWERAARLTEHLYPDDSSRQGKVLRLRQQYFLCSASLQDMVRRYLRTRGDDLSGFAGTCAIQLNDTHPVIAIPELIRILTEEHGMSFEQSLELAGKTFSYTNHTVMPEALEAWGCDIFREAVPHMYDIVELLEDCLVCELHQSGRKPTEFGPYKIIRGGKVYMASLAMYICHRVNGVSKIHTGIVRDVLFSHWEALYPGKIVNITNGITPRRWLALANLGLSGMITELCGEGWQTDLSRLEQLGQYAGDASVLERLEAVKQENKREFCRYLKARHGILLDDALLFDVQVKRIHEYKRQLLNAFSVLDIYYDLREGKLMDFVPTAVLFGGKAYPGYARAKGIVRFICQIAKMINQDPATRELLQVVFIPDYNVSTAEKLIPAAQISQQISTAGTEASGTGNMKLSLNGAVTVGTFDGANIEIFQGAGEENNYVFGARMEELRRISEEYDPRVLYEGNERIRRAVDTLVGKAVKDEGSGIFTELHQSLLVGAQWNRADNYFLIHDFLSYAGTRLQAILDSADKKKFYQKGLMNISGSGYFSSDRAIGEYARQIWNIATDGF